MRRVVQTILLAVLSCLSCSWLLRLCMKRLIVVVSGVAHAHTCTCLLAVVYICRQWGGSLCKLITPVRLKMLFAACYSSLVWCCLLCLVCEREVYIVGTG